MFTSAKPTSVIDSVAAREGKFTVEPGASTPELEITMVYSNHQTKVTFGTCPAKTLCFSEKTMESFRTFIKNAEEDFGALILEGGFIADAEGAPALGMAETNNGIKPRGLGEQ
jgi:hypothetical protein